MSRHRIQSLAELGALRKALEAEQRARAEAERRAREEAARRDALAREFERAVGAVTPLLRPPTVEHPRPAPEPLPRQREADERAALAQSLSDEFDPATLLDSDAELGWHRPTLGPEVVRKLRGGHWVIQGELDLHGARTEEARELLGDFLRHALRTGLRCVRVVHGKGLGSKGRQPVLKGKVKRWLVQREEVIAFCQARAPDGGAGALIVLLRATR
ncbi:Smr/MutS family protein [Derxia lacustris]|uniref:Smr/MutS family protein n=1 Tax=Derxia lacustris TaxID=764842 RepID=UPI000A176A04|nr:Smr/MutS family protein [Derxia lacustris]